MVIRDLDPLRPLIRPLKAEPILFVNADTMLTVPIPAQGFQVVAGRYGERGQGHGRVELIQLPLSYPPESFRTHFPGGLGGPSIEDILGSLIVKRKYHLGLALFYGPIVTDHVIHVKEPDGRYLVPESGPFGPTEPVWKYEDEDKGTFHSEIISGAERRENGNTLICQGKDGRFFEVTPGGEIVSEYWTPYSGTVTLDDGSQPHPVRNNTYAVFRATKILPDHPARGALSPLSILNPLRFRASMWRK